MDNVLKLEGYGVYVTYIDSNLFICDITGSGPKLDPDGCIEWEELKDPPNQKFLNLANAMFSTTFTMRDFDCPMRISDIKSHVAAQKEMSESALRWEVKNMKEKNK